MKCYELIEELIGEVFSGKCWDLKIDENQLKKYFTKVSSFAGACLFNSDSLDRENDQVAEKGYMLLFDDSVKDGWIKRSNIIFIGFFPMDDSPIGILTNTEKHSVVYLSNEEKWEIAFENIETFVKFLQNQHA